MNNLRKTFIFVAGIVFFISSPVLSAQKSPDNGPMIRIAIARDIDNVTVKVNGSYEIINPQNREILGDGLKFPTSIVSKGTRGIKVGSKDYALQRIRFYGRRDVTVIHDGKEHRYRGYVDVFLNPNGKLLIVNQLELEDYVRGVLYHEVSNRWPMEALKVQAVATRTYAIFQMKMNFTKDFDVTNDIYSQVYGGRTGERYRTNLAVDATPGQILTYQGKVIPAYFHATCGGHTEDVKEVWPRHDMPPLKGVRCIYCRESPHYFWKKNFQLKDIQDSLNTHGFKIGTITDIAIVDRNENDRIRKLVIADQDGKQLNISGKDFRDAVGPNIIRSNNYYIVMQGTYCDLFGKGWGHGVGMCQWGAQGMATQGFTYDKILQFYYPGTDIATIKSPEQTRTF